jgi:pyridoxamine 5'-phosphate oxidase family protein
LSVFTPAEIEYLRGQTLGRLATVGPDGQPHVVPMTYWLNAEQDTIDIGGINFGASKKWRDVQGNDRVTFLVDDTLTDPMRARAVEVRGRAELFNEGGPRINPRFPNFAEEFIRIHPTRIVGWGIEEDAARDAETFRPNARNVR